MTIHYHGFEGKLFLTQRSLDYALAEGFWSQASAEQHPAARLLGVPIQVVSDGLVEFGYGILNNRRVRLW